MRQCFLSVWANKHYVITELSDKIAEAQKESKKSIKAQKVGAICESCILSLCALPFK